MTSTNFSYSFLSTKSIESIFPLLLDVRSWWSGVYNESITGKSEKVGDEFRFVAGGGVHDTTQKLIEVRVNKKVLWKVTASNLSFLEEPEEWKDTQFGFELSGSGDKTKITFTHEGLIPEIECFDDCSAGWTHYLNNLKNKLK